jgi:hypothetical protein
MSTQYRATHLDSQVSGEFLLCFIYGSGLFSKVLLEALANHGIKNIRLGKWYPQQPFLDTMRTIQKTIGAVILRQVGLNIGANISTPPSVQDIPTLLATLAKVYALHHKHDPKHVQVVIQTENSAQVTYNSPYPPNLEYGILTGLLERFSPESQNLSISNVEQPGAAIKNSHAVQYYVKW